MFAERSHFAHGASHIGIMIGLGQTFGDGEGDDDLRQHEAPFWSPKCLSADADIIARADFGNIGTKPYIVTRYSAGNNACAQTRTLFPERALQNLK